MTLDPMHSKYFSTKELVDETTYSRYGEAARMFIDEGLLALINVVRSRNGRMLINNWHTGGKRNWQGLRTAEYYDGGKPAYSQHIFGRAVDMHPLDSTVDEVRKDIIDNWEEILEAAGYNSKGVKPRGFVIEEDVSWIHLDTRPAVSGLETFKP